MADPFALNIQGLSFLLISVEIIDDKLISSLIFDVVVAIAQRGYRRYYTNLCEDICC